LYHFWYDARPEFSPVAGFAVQLIKGAVLGKRSGGGATFKE
jgi:hypothetical protein